MEISLVTATPNPLKAAYIAARRCYSEEISIPEVPEDTAKVANLVRRVIGMGHTGILESIQLTFHISGISRVSTHQLVRHRVAGYCQQSQRYAEVQDNYTIPDSVIRHGFGDEYRTFMDHAADFYKRMAAGGVPIEDARFIIPHCSHSSILVNMNARQLFDVFFPKRLCTRAQWEIRRAAKKMYELSVEYCPEIFSLTGSACEKLKYCPEGKYSCGRYSTIDQLLDSEGGLHG